MPNIWVPSSSTGTIMTASTDTTTIWAGWNSTYSTSTGTGAYLTTTWEAWNEQTERTYAQAVEAQHEAQRREQERRAERHQAGARAEALLLELLTEEQAASYTGRGYFEVRGSAGGRYRIRRRSQAGNVDLMPETGEVRLASFCCHPPGGLPLADAHLAQMLHLVTDEPGFRQVANAA